MKPGHFSLHHVSCAYLLLLWCVSCVTFVTPNTSYMYTLYALIYVAIQIHEYPLLMTYIRWEWFYISKVYIFFDIKPRNDVHFSSTAG